MSYVLPPQQLEILRLVAAGMPQAEIARRLHITTDTVKTHLRRLYQSMGATNAPHAVAIAYRLGILSTTKDCCRQHLVQWLAVQARQVRDG